MNEKKCCIPALIISIIGMVLGFFCFGVEAVAAGGIGLGLSIAKRNTHRTKLSGVISVIAMLMGLAWIIWLIYLGSRGMSYLDYWLFRLLFGEHA